MQMPVDTPDSLAGLTLVVAAGIIVGLGAWPIKRIRHLQFEHWAFTANVFSLLILPWTITLLTCPDAFGAYREVGWRVLLKANVFSLLWGVANVLATLSWLRIGIALQTGLLISLATPIGVLVPVIFKGSGLFAQAPGLLTPPGLTLLAGVGITGISLACMTTAAVHKERLQHPTRGSASSHRAGFAMAVVAGILSTGYSFSFVYSQGPVVAAMTARGAGPASAGYAVWAAGLLAGSLVNLAYPLALMARRRNGGMLLREPRDLAYAVVAGLCFVVTTFLVGTGMRRLGPLGASVGTGIYGACALLSATALGFGTGEWTGVHGTPRRLMFAAVLLLVAGIAVMSCANNPRLFFSPRLPVGLW